MKSKLCKATSALVSVVFASSLTASVTKPYQASANEQKSVSDLKSKLLQKKNAEMKVGDTLAGHKKVKVDEENKRTSNNPEETVRVIVELNADSASEKAGDASKATKSMINSTIAGQASIKQQVEKIANNKVKNTYGNLINGFSINVKRKDIEKIKKLKGVENVTEARVFYPTMTTAKDLTQVKDVWKNKKYKGEGLVAAIIDTGIDYTHKDMKAPADSSKLKIKENTYNDGGKYFTNKVPYGYNFADKNNQVIDKSGSMHGMHVAGIVAADGSQEEVNNGEAIQGVAPEAQLLAMKVFSNDPNNSGAFSDDIVAAIEKSVELKADVINMSLGSTAGFVDSDDPEQKAIKEAADAGVICVVSAGNESYSTNPYVLDNQKDTATVGSPGLATEAIEVASSENTNVHLNALTATVNGKIKNFGYTQSSVDPRDKFSAGQKLEIVNCGYGDVSDFAGKDLKGKVALIQRGKLNFTVKQDNAQAAGAAAVIVYNNQGNSYINMASNASLEIPALFIAQSDGEALLSDKKATIEFNGKTVVTANVASQQMSDFTSWGPAPDLQFAPEVTAPGGNIFSTVNDNRYASMSGTSMAAPHTTGVTALAVQAVKEKNLGLTGKDLVSYVKNSLINTAKILYDKEGSDGTVPYSPRRQGAGLVQAEYAINNTVLATADDGQATVSLKEVGEKTEFNITLKNYGDKDQTYSMKTPGGVLTSKVPEDGMSVSVMNCDTVLNGAKVTFDKDKVTVPAKSNVTVKATLKIDSKTKKGNYAEGYIQFKNETSAPSLVVPYMGFYGDWSAEKIISPMTWEKESNDYLIPSFAVVPYKGSYNYAGFDGRDENGVKINPNKIAISPNNDGKNDKLVPELYMWRNAKNMSVDILDKDNKVIAENVAKVDNVRKQLLSKSTSPAIKNNLSWDGTAYNAENGKKEPVKDGQYYMKIKSKVMTDGKEQDTVVPVKVDATAPKITLTSAQQTNSTSYKLTFTIDEATSGLQAYLASVNGKTVKTKTTDNVHYTADVTLDEDNDNEIEIAALDNAENISDESFTVSTKVDKTPVLFSNVQPSQEYTEKNVTFEGRVTNNVQVLRIANKDVKINDNKTFSVNVTLNEGVNTIPVYAADKNGKELMNYGLKVFCDTTAPVITLDSALVSNGVINAASHKVTLKGKVSDNVFGYKFYINEQQILSSFNEGKFGPQYNEKEFTKELTVNDGDIVSLKAIDDFGNKVEQKYIVKINPGLGVKVSEVADGGLYNKDVTPVVEYNEKEYDVTMTLNGAPYTKGQAITEQGDYTLVVNSALKGEKSPVRSQIFKFTIDKTAPIIKVEGVENGKLYNKDVTPVITVEQGATVTEMTLDGKEYDKAVVSTDGVHKLVVKAVDKAGNETKYEAEFTLDKTAPEITVEGVQDGFKYENEVKAVVKANEKTSELTVTLDGKAYDGSVINTDGKHELKVTAVDLAGNKSEKTVTFTVEMPKPANQKPDPSKKPGNNQGKPGTVNPTNDDNAGKVSGNANVVKGSNGTGVSGTVSTSGIPKTGSFVNAPSIVIAALIMIVTGVAVVFTKRKRRL